MDAALGLLGCLGSLTEAGTAGDGLLPCTNLIVLEGHQENSCRWRPANFTVSKKMVKRSMG